VFEVARFRRTGLQARLFQGLACRAWRPDLQKTLRKRNGAISKTVVGEFAPRAISRGLPSVNLATLRLISRANGISGSFDPHTPNGCAGCRRNPILRCLCSLLFNIVCPVDPAGMGAAPGCGDTSVWVQCWNSVRILYFLKFPVTPFRFR